MHTISTFIVASLLSIVCSQSFAQEIKFEFNHVTHPSSANHNIKMIVFATKGIFGSHNASMLAWIPAGKKIETSVKSTMLAPTPSGNYKVSIHCSLGRQSHLETKLFVPDTAKLVSFTVSCPTEKETPKLPIYSFQIT